MKKGVLLAAYGASNQEGRIELDRFERRCRARFPGLPVRWAFTSPFQRDRLANQKRKSDSVSKALMRCHFEMFEEIAIQPLQIIPGREHQAMMETVREFEKKTAIKCLIGQPLIADAKDIPAVAQGLAAYAREQALPEDNAIFMAHGARHAAGRLFESLAKELGNQAPGVFLATMISPPKLENILPELTAKRVWLLPMLSVAGVHALRDMAGGDAQSWKSRIEKSGHNCIPVLQGLIESDFFASCWLRSLETLVEKLDSH